MADFTTAIKFLGTATDFLGSAKALTGGSAIFGAASEVQAGRAARREAEFKARILREDALNQKRIAPLLRKEGREAAAEIQKATAGLIGEQRAAMAANGIVLDQGTALDLVTQTSGQGAVDAITAIANSEREAAQLVRQANINLTKADLVEQAGENVQEGSYISAGRSLLKGARDIGKITDMFGNDDTDSEATTGTAPRKTGGLPPPISGNQPRELT